MGLSENVDAPLEPPGPGVSPFSVEVDVLDRMLNVEIHDDPRYSGLEIQVFDDEFHGRGTVVFLSRTEDGRTDVYYEPGLRLDPAGYAIGTGLGEWREADIDPKQVDFSPNGIDVDVGLTDRVGRRVEVRVNDTDGRTRHPATMLAPMGSAIRSPNRLPLVWMTTFDLVRAPSHLEVVVGGDSVKIGHLPGSRLHHRELVKYASDLFVVSLNPSRSGPLSDMTLRGVTASMAGHSAGLRLDRTCSLVELLNGENVRGTWSLDIDDSAAVVGGSWGAQRSGPHISLGLEVLEGWHPIGLPPLMKLVTTVAPVFREWPTTYRWSATVDLDLGTMVSRWERTEEAGDEEYRAFTGSRTITR